MDFRRFVARLPLVNRLVRPLVLVTSVDVENFWVFMSGRFGTRIVEKASAPEMNTVAEFLDLIGVVDKTTFMTRFTTTFNKTIYVPFKVGVNSPTWPLWQQILICAHEHMHVVQEAKEGTVGFGWKYITSTAARTMYEVEAYRTGMELDWRYMRNLQSPHLIAGLLGNYGLTVADVQVAEKALSLAIPAIKQGGLTTEVGRIAAGWLDRRYGVR